MSESRTMTLAELGEVNPKVDLHRLNADSLVSFIPMSDVTESGRWVNRQERRFDDVRFGYTPFTEGDVLFAKITPCMENGKGTHARGLKNGVGFGTTEFHVLRARRENSARFLFHSLQARTTRTRAIAYMGGSAGQQSVQPDFFTNYRVHRIGPEEQSLIAAVLDTVDEAIAKTEAVVAKLRQVRVGLLQDLLTRGLDRNGQLRDPIAHPEQFQDSPIGRIPKEWRICGVLDVAPPDRQAILTGPFGAQLSQKDFVQHGVPVLRIGNVQFGYIDWSDTQFVTEAKAAELRRFRLIPGDLLFARQGATTGRNALADDRATGAIINYHIIRVATDKALCEPRFMNALFNADSALRQINREKARGTREGINTDQLAALRFAMPPIDEQRLTVRAVSSLDNQETSELVNLDKLLQIRSGLSNDLLSGRVRLPPNKRGPA
jgi:type I restriction enzyme, S subunit